MLCGRGRIGRPTSAGSPDHTPDYLARASSPDAATTQARE